MVSSLFYDWAVLYLVLVFIAIYMYEPKNFRNWLVPVAGVFAVFMIAYCVLVLANRPQLLSGQLHLPQFPERRLFFGLGQQYQAPCVRPWDFNSGPTVVP